MKESKPTKWGRNAAVFFDYYIGLLPISHEEKERYKAMFLDETQNFSFEPKKKGEPRNSGCVDELQGIDTIDPKNPYHVAKWFKQGIQMWYQKRTQKNGLEPCVKMLYEKSGQ